MIKEIEYFITDILEGLLAIILVVAFITIAIIAIAGYIKLLRLIL